MGRGSKMQFFKVNDKQLGNKKRLNEQGNNM